MLIVYEQVTLFLGWEGYLSWTQYCYVLSYVCMLVENVMDLVTIMISMQLECCISSLQVFWIFSCTCTICDHYALFSSTAAAVYCFTTVVCTAGIAAYKAICMHDSEDGVSSEEGPTCSMKSVICIVNTLQDFPLSSFWLLTNKHKKITHVFVADSSHFYFKGPLAYIRTQYIMSIRKCVSLQVCRDRRSENGVWERD